MGCVAWGSSASVGPRCHGASLRTAFPPQCPELTHLTTALEIPPHEPQIFKLVTRLYT